MSAIYGIYHLNSESIQRDHINTLVQSLQQFPSDDIQLWNKDNVFLGCHSQWITPESINENLPYYDYDRQLVITSDAIIDNRDELFDLLNVELEQRKVMSDSKLILLSYYKWGQDAPKYLVGEFAFVIWDEKKKLLFAARDFSGSRTLYYFHNHEAFSFCTTINPLLSLPYTKKDLNLQWIAEYLAIPGMNEAVDTSITPYSNVQQLQPSHTITICKDRIKVSRYCNFASVKPLKLKDNQEYVEVFKEIFQNSVNSRLRTYRQVGAHLSGGLDSGAVVSFAARTLKKENKQLHTYSYVPSDDFEDWTPKSQIADETPLINSTVNFVGNIKDYYYNFDNHNPLNEIDDWLDIMEMPYKFFPNSVWIKGIFIKASENGDGVLLNGGRGNLGISWGSALDYYAILLKKMKWIQLISELNQYSKNVGGNRLRLLPIIGKVAFPTIGNYLHKDKPYQFPMLISQKLAEKTDVYEKLHNHGIQTSRSRFDNSIFESKKRHFQELYSWNATGTLGTKLSLRYSLWKRDPTNDLRVIRYCLSLPEGQYVQNGMDRALIRRATKELLPDQVRLNRVRGAQGVDYIHRLAPYWDTLICELEQLIKDPIVGEILNVKLIKDSIALIKNQGPKPELALDPDFWILIRSMIVYRFIKRFD